LVTVFRGRREIVKLTPDKNASFYAMNYKYTYYPRDNLHEEHPIVVLYTCCPVQMAVRLRVSRVNYVGERVGQKSQDNFSAIGFIYKMGDTICASRAGVSTIVLTKSKKVKKDRMCTKATGTI
jgi:hypothetical protein